MIVVSLVDCPPGLRGDITQWLQEISTGVYVGHVSARVRDEIWDRVCKNAKHGRATMVYSVNNEQHMDFRVYNNDWVPIEFDGLKLMLRPNRTQVKTPVELREGFSNAAKINKRKHISNRSHHMQSQLDRYAVIDLETTGLSSLEDEIIEISAIIVEGKEITRTFNNLIKPKSKLPELIRKLTGITDEMIMNEGKELEESLPVFLRFLGELPVVSHNADFDFSFVRQACKTFNFPLFSNKAIDTLALARRLVDDVDNYKLTTLLAYFGIDTNGMHRSLEDCKTTKRLYEKLIAIMQEME